MSDQNAGWDLPTINARLDELHLRKNRLTLTLKNDPTKIGREILQIESLIQVNQEVKDFLLEREPTKFH